MGSRLTSARAPGQPHASRRSPSSTMETCTWLTVQLHQAGWLSVESISPGRLCHEPRRSTSWCAATKNGSPPRLLNIHFLKIHFVLSAKEAHRKACGSKCLRMNFYLSSCSSLLNHRRCKHPFSDTVGLCWDSTLTAGLPSLSPPCLPLYMPPVQELLIKMRLKWTK